MVWVNETHQYLLRVITDKPLGVECHALQERSRIDYRLCRQASMPGLQGHGCSDGKRPISSFLTAGNTQQTRLNYKDECGWINVMLFYGGCVSNKQLSQHCILTETVLQTHLMVSELRAKKMKSPWEGTFYSRSLVAAAKLLVTDSAKLFQSKIASLY